MPIETHWDESYSVGNPILDHQHKRLLRACNELAAYVEHNNPDSDAKYHEILNVLSTYAREHFTTEEAILKQLGYPDLDEHIEDHFTYIERLTDILTQASMGVLDKAGTLMFLARWWTEHILVSDMRYKSLFDQQA